MRAKWETLVLSSFVAFFLAFAIVIIETSMLAGHPTHERLEVSDVSLLTEEEKLEALMTDSASFSAGGTRYVITTGARDVLADYI